MPRMDERSKRHLKRIFARFVRSSKKLSNSDNLGSTDPHRINAITIRHNNNNNIRQSDRFEASFGIIR